MPRAIFFMRFMSKATILATFIMDPAATKSRQNSASTDRKQLSVFIAETRNFKGSNWIEFQAFCDINEGVPTWSTFHL
jgi:hypothetical protein